MPTTFAESTADRTRAKRLGRIRTLSRVMALLCLATSALLVVSMLVYWISTPAGTLLATAGLTRVAPTEIGMGMRIAAFGISMAPLGALIYGLLMARGCFDAFVAGQIFSHRTVGRLTAFSVAIMVSALLKPFAGASLSVLLSWNAPAGMRSLVVNLGSDTLLTLIFAGTVAIIAWVMTDAIAIADENAQII